MTAANDKLTASQTSEEAFSKRLQTQIEVFGNALRAQIEAANKVGKMSFWVRYEFETNQSGYIKGGRRRIGPFKERDAAEKALIALCARVDFRGGHIERGADEEIESCPTS